MLLLFKLRCLNDHLFGKELFIRFTVSVFRGRLSKLMCSSFSFGTVCRTWVVIVLIIDHCLSIYLQTTAK